MKHLGGKTAIVTGAGSGIGSGISETLAEVGMNVAVADISLPDAERVAARINGQGGKAMAIQVDVSDRASVMAAGAAVEAAFGKLHIAVNNAGIGLLGSPILEIKPEEWDWVIGVNMYGVIHGIQVFLPMIQRHGEGGHIVNTASIGGLQVNPGWYTTPYSMTKFAVVALSEGLHNELDGTNVGVSVLCPAAVRTNIADSGRRRPERMGGAYDRPQQAFMKDTLADGLLPAEVGQRVLQAILNDEFFVFTHSAPRPWIEARHARLQDAFDRAAEFEARSRRGRAAE